MNSRVELLGNVTKDPKVTYTATGAALLKLGVAVDEGYQAKDGKWVSETNFYDVTVWRDQAEACGKYLKKGSQVFVEGRLKMSKWQNDVGADRSKLEIHARQVHFLGGKQNTNEEPEEDTCPF